MKIPISPITISDILHHQEFEVHTICTASLDLLLPFAFLLNFIDFSRDVMLAMKLFSEPCLQSALLTGSLEAKSFILSKLPQLKHPKLICCTSPFIHSLHWEQKRGGGLNHTTCSQQRPIKQASCGPRV